MARIILQLCQGTEMAKIDIASAFRLIPVHPDGRYLLGMKWNDQVYIDRQLPFGLRSAPLLFNGYADALEWIIQASGVHHILHYLDDFLVLGPPRSGVCMTGCYDVHLSVSGCPFGSRQNCWACYVFGIPRHWTGLSTHVSAIAWWQTDPTLPGIARSLSICWVFSICLHSAPFWQVLYASDVHLVAQIKWSQLLS